MNNTHNCRILLPSRGHRGIADTRWTQICCRPNTTQREQMHHCWLENIQAHSSFNGSYVRKSVDPNCAFGTSPTLTRTHALISQVFFHDFFEEVFIGPGRYGHRIVRQLSVWVRKFLACLMVEVLTRDYLADCHRLWILRWRWKSRWREGPWRRFWEHDRFWVFCCGDGMVIFCSNNGQPTMHEVGCQNKGLSGEWEF